MNATPSIQGQDANRCPRCGKDFRCGAGLPGPCACAGVALSVAQLQRLREHYSGCLCLTCLQTLASEAAPPH